MSPDAPEIRVVTYNTAAGNPRITTPQVAFLELPFYREALAGGPGAPILALQEVGRAQSRALRARTARAGATVVEKRRPGLGNALVIPDRYEVLETAAGFYGRSHVRGVARALARWRRTRARPDWRQFGELRMWLRARVRERASGQELTVLTTHLSLDPDLRRAQAAAVVRRARAAAAHGPVVLAGDLNSTAGGLPELLAGFRDMGTAAPHGRPDIDHVLAIGFEPVSSRIWTGASLRLPGSPTAELVSDHYPEDDVLRVACSP